MILSQEQSKSLLKNLPWGWQKKLAEKCKCTPRHVFNVIHAFRDDHSNIVNEALKLIKEKQLRESKINKKIENVCK